MLRWHVWYGARPQPSALKGTSAEPRYAAMAENRGCRASPCPHHAAEPRGQHGVGGERQSLRASWLSISPMCEPSTHGFRIPRRGKRVRPPPGLTGRRLRGNGYSVDGCTGTVTTTLCQVGSGCQRILRTKIAPSPLYKGHLSCNTMHVHCTLPCPIHA